MLTSLPTLCFSELIRRLPPKLKEKNRRGLKPREESRRPKKTESLQKKLHQKSNLRRTKKSNSMRRLKRPEMKKSWPV